MALDERSFITDGLYRWNTEGRQKLEMEARSFVDLAYLTGCIRICWLYDAPYSTWTLGQWIIMLSDIVGYPIKGGYDMGQPKDHGNRERYQGHPPIPGRTLFL